MGNKRTVTKAQRMTKSIQDTNVEVRVKPSVQISVAIMMFAALVLAAGFIAPFLLSSTREITVKKSPTIAVLSNFDLAEAYAPAWYQDTHNDWWADMIVAFNYDGDYRGDNNWEHYMDYDPLAYIYYSIIETETHWFITYSDFHARDTADICVGSACHENDMEGAMAVVRKTDDELGELEYIETIFHNDINAYTADQVPTDDGRRVRLYVESKGHGVKNDTQYTQTESGNFPGGDGLIYRYSGTAGNASLFQPANEDNREVGYALLSFEDEIWDRRNSCCGSGYMFDGPFQYNGMRFSLPGNLPGAFDGENHADDKAKPAWSWDDDDDYPRKGDFGIDPALTVYNHFYPPSGDFSLEYTDNFYFDCFDGTAHGQCNPDTDQYCSYGQLAPCPNNTQCNGQTLLCGEACSDGTSFETCAQTRPLYCGEVEPEVPSSILPRMVCLYRTGQEGARNDACEVVALVSDPKPGFYNLSDNDWRGGRDPVITEPDGTFQFHYREMCDPDDGCHGNDGCGSCTADCWNITGASGNNSGNDGLDDIFCAAGVGCSPVSFSGCPSEDLSCINEKRADLEEAYHKVVYYHWADNHNSPKGCDDDNGEQKYRISVEAGGWPASHCAVPRCEYPTPDDPWDGFDRLQGLIVLPSDMMPVSRMTEYELRDECLLCGCPRDELSPVQRYYCNYETGRCDSTPPEYEQEL